MHNLKVVSLVVFCLILFFQVSGSVGAQNITYIYTADSNGRMDYLANAVIWKDPGDITPEMILEGRPDRFPLSYSEANAPEGIPCVFLHVGQDLGGKTQKFVCRAPNNHAVRVKYYEGSNGNREIFAAVASTRLLWILGFSSDSVYPVRVQCIDCPLNPFTGRGNPKTRILPAVIETHYDGTLILSKADLEQGWTWEELDLAIQALPEGELKTRQRTHFDALALLGVLIQHGDRKRSQQRLTCQGAIKIQPENIHPAPIFPDSTHEVPVLFENLGEKVCTQAAVTIQDVGATLGSAGATTHRIRSKMNLQEWAKKAVFEDDKDSKECRGNLRVAIYAGAPGESHPRISEEGRQFLSDRLTKITDDQWKALFTASQVEELGDENRWEDPETGEIYSGVDAWVVVMKNKIEEIEQKRCTPLAEMN
jgi:hypothetical protein